MRQRTHLFAAIVVIAAAAADPAAVKRACKADVVAMNAALVKGDFAAVADLTHPKVLANLGGRAKTIDVMAAGAKQMKAQGVAFRSADVADPSDAVPAGPNLYVVVPYTFTMTVPTGVMRQRSFVIGVSADAGLTWKYVNGDLDMRLIKSVLPGLPAALKLPAKQQPIVTKS